MSELHVIAFLFAWWSDISDENNSCKKTQDLSVLQCVLGITNAFTVGEAGGERD